MFPREDTPRDGLALRALRALRAPREAVAPPERVRRRLRDALLRARLAPEEVRARLGLEANVRPRVVLARGARDAVGARPRDTLLRDTRLRDTLLRDTLLRDTLLRDGLERDTRGDRPREKLLLGLRERE